MCPRSLSLSLSPHPIPTQLDTKVILSLSLSLSTSYTYSIRPKSNHINIPASESTVEWDSFVSLQIRASEKSHWLYFDQQYSRLAWPTARITNSERVVNSKVATANKGIYSWLLRQQEGIAGYYKCFHSSFDVDCRA